MKATLAHEALLRGAPLGSVLWLPAQGQSLWPLFHHGDVLKVQRVGPEQVVLGDVAVVGLPGEILAAHVVVGLGPLVTASTAGVVDPPAREVFAVVVGLQRDGRLFTWPRALSPLWRWWPSAARVVKRAPGVRRLVRFLRDGTHR